MCCVTNGPVDQVAALLALLRPLADEIVVAIDSSGPEEDFGPVLELADVAHALFVGPVGAERVLNWLHRECSSDWILRIDSDEVPSAALLEALPSLVRSTDTLQYLVPRRWCFPDCSHWLDERPWAPDWQPRLARNVPGLRLTPEPWHAGLARMDPCRHLVEPLYHLDCATTSLPARERKAGMYEQLRPGHRTEDGANVNAYYLPEHHSSRPVASVPPEDLALIDQVLRPKADRRRRARRPKARIARVIAKDVDQFWAFREIPESAYKASVTLLDPLPELRAGSSTSVTVRAANHGTEIWPYGDTLPAFRLAHRWVATGADPAVREGRRTMFTADVGPGEEIVQPMTLVAPPEPGEYTLYIDVVHEFERWLDSGPVLDVTVVP
ncbi:MAG: hypothetical protein ACXVJS_00050 [Acidimicrobiia bacterium]